MSAKPPTAGVWIDLVLGVGSSLMRGIDPHFAADKLDAATKARGGDPVEIWRIVHRLSCERLTRLGVQVPACACARPHPSYRCETCGGEIPQKPDRVEVIDPPP